MRNIKFAKENKLFLECCRLANVPPTPRQASKYKNGKGLAYGRKGEVIRKKLIDGKFVIPVKEGL